MSKSLNQNELKALLDTNFLLAPAELGVDVIDKLDQMLGNHKIIIPTCVKEELRRLKEKGKIRDQEFDLALNLANKYEENNICSFTNDPDECFIKYAPGKNLVVCTNDKELISSLRSKEVPVIFIRQNKLLDKIGVIE